MEWQPIETAPKDRRSVLLWGIHPERADVGAYDPDTYSKRPKPYWTAIGSERLYGVRYVREHQPTHWAPLPEPPK